jgi:hypothetical protein
MKNNPVYEILAIGLGAFIMACFWTALAHADVWKVDNKIFTEKSAVIRYVIQTHHENHIIVETREVVVGPKLNLKHATPKIRQENTKQLVVSQTNN